MNYFFDLFKKVPTKEASKWTPYFEAYEKHLTRFIDRAPILFEIGVAQGGSLQFWKEAMGKDSTIVGIDILKECIDHEDKSKGIFVEIGNGRNLEFMKSLFRKYGTPDIVIDDGDHNSLAMKTSLNCIWPYLNNSGVYLIEDLHGIFWQAQEDWDTSMMNYIFELIQSINAPGCRGHLQKLDNFKSLSQIGCYWSIVALEKNSRPNPKAIRSKNGILTAFTSAD